MDVAVITPVKLENRYIREFVEHYKKLGFSTVILADNNDIHGEHLEEVIGDYIASGFVKVENFRGQPRSNTLQNTINQIIWDKYNQDYDWLAVFDADEFLELDPKYKDISEFLNLDRFKDADEIRFNWILYGDAGMIKPVNNDYSLEARFKKVTNISQLSFRGDTKAIYRGHKNIVFLPDNCYCCHHGANVGGISRDVNVKGNPVNHADMHVIPAILEEAWISHYNTKTLLEFVWFKNQRRGIDRSEYTLNTYQNINKHWTIDELIKILKIYDSTN